MHDRDDIYFIVVRWPFRLLGMLMTIVGGATLLYAVLNIEESRQKLGDDFLLTLLPILPMFLLFIGSCSVAGHLPFCIARRLPEWLLEVMRDAPLSLVRDRRSK